MFLEGLKINLKSSTFCMIADGFHNFWLPFCEENQIKFLVVSVKSPSNPLQKAYVSGFLIAACHSKSCSESHRL
jgi:hypothetical protein